MAPFSASKSIQNRSKLDPEGHPKIDTFSHRLPTLFCSILGPKMGPCWSQVETKIASRADPGRPLPGGSWAPTAAFRPPEPSKWYLQAPKMDPRPPQNPPKSFTFLILKGPQGPCQDPWRLGPQAPIPAQARRNGAEPL